MDTSATTGSDEMIFIHDDEGNDYLVSRATLKHAQVPPELKTDVEHVIKGETSGYDGSLAKLVIAYYGVGKGDKAWDMAQKYDFNANGVIDWGDVKIAQSMK